MNRKLWSVVVCLSLAVVAVAVLIYIQRQKTIRTATASPRRVLAQRTGHASFQPDTHKDLLFDPVLAYSTYLGGASSANYPFDMIQVASVIVTDATGNLYVAGSTNSRSFPVTSSVVEPNNPQKGLLGFLAKLDPTGQTLLFSTYIDGISGVSAMALDANGDIYVAGTAISANNLGIPVLPIP